MIIGSGFTPEHSRLKYQVSNKVTENTADVSGKTVSSKSQETMGFFARFSRLELGTVMESEPVVTFACAAAIIMALCGSEREISRTILSQEARFLL